MSKQIYLGIDLGAESGRVMAGSWDGGRLGLEEVHRFGNGGVWVGETFRWDLVRLWAEIQNGLAIAGKKFGDAVVSIGVDTWGVDFVLLDRKDEMLGLPYHYRDGRTRGMMEEAFGKVSRDEIFANTGSQFMEINSLYQLLALKKTNPELLASADRFLMIADWLNWCLCGSRVVEFTNASTTQCLNPARRTWAFEMLRKFGLPENIFGELVEPGTKIGQLRESVAALTGLGRVVVIAPPTHDTAAAVAGVPTANTGRANWAYISSGTWSLLGIESQTPLLSKNVLEANLTNEGGIDGTWRVLKNIMGLWLVQQLKRSFEVRGKNFDYAELVRLAAAEKTSSVIDPDDARCLNPANMAEAIQACCREAKQSVPQTEGALVRCALESLANKYGDVLAKLEQVSGEKIECIHIVGGGSRNDLLNQLTANRCKRPVIAGPVETTVLGNLLTQLRASGQVRSLSEMREIVRKSSDVREFAPQ
ncbi:MAG: Rhamnulokinase [Verrucomicrobiales bacterium]|nr:Rhamnulokinase [Verrucomicrobiales bacterium]